MITPLVSICCITYNHAPFIRQCLDGFLMQKGVNYEILIHDDCSTDGTTEIVKEYAAKYPDLIFPLYETENQYSKPGRESMDFYNYRRARGKYIAYCEGDDYWTDPLKLQKQVEFMEANPEYSVCFHDFINFDINNGENITTEPSKLLKERKAVDGLDIDIDTYFKKWYTQPTTMLFRVSNFSFDWANKYHGYRDMHEIYHLLKAGKCRLMNFVGGVRNIHDGGITHISFDEYITLSLRMDKEFFLKNLDRVTKRQYVSTLEESIKYYSKQKSKVLKYSLLHFMLTGHIRGLIRHLSLMYGK